jgi:hypothetical protein
MNKLKERIKSFKNVEKLLDKEYGKNSTFKMWTSWEINNPWYVIKEKNNIIKFSWQEAFSVRTICVVITWDKKYDQCKLIYNDSKSYEYKPKIINLNKNIIIELENYLRRNNYLNYSVKEKDQVIQLDGSKSELEMKINKKYNVESDCAIDNKIIYNFAVILFELSGEYPGEILGT